MFPTNLKTNEPMITTNMRDLVQQLQPLGEVSIKDTNGQVMILLPRHVDISRVDDLVCDAVFADPSERVLHKNGWTIYLIKRDRNRPPADEMFVLDNGDRHTYRFSAYAA